MTNRIDTIFDTLRRDGRKGIMPFICGGYPAEGTTRHALPAFAEAGAAIAEVGIPFSDPIADGPVIAAAMHDALQRGVTPATVIDELREARADPRCDALGLVAMVSVSIVHRRGPDAFANQLAEAGVDGVVLPDVPVDEAHPVSAPIRERGLTVSLLVAPTTPPARAEQIARACSGFVYLLARAGITGEQAGGPEDALARRVEMLRGCTDLPIAVGFGVSDAHRARVVTRDAGADAAIVGTALVKRMGDAEQNGQDPVRDAADLVRELVQGVA